MLHWFNKSEQMKHPKLRSELQPNEKWFFITLILTTNKMSYHISSTEMSRWQKMYSLQEIQAWYPSRSSRDNCRTCLWSCSKEGFKTVSILIANISCEMWIPETIITMWRPRHRRKAKNVFANMCLRSLQLIRRPFFEKMHKTFATVKRKNLPLKSGVFHNCNCWNKCIGLD